jgi:hypothetical protein
MQATEINCILAYKKFQIVSFSSILLIMEIIEKNNTGASNQKITASSGTGIKTCIPDL